MKDYYRILGLSRKATRAEIRKRWLELAQRYHPDHNPGDKASDEKFREVREAYGVLYDEKQRALYDINGGLNLFGSAPRPKPAHDYFYCRISPATVRLNDEVEVSFTYSAAGRIFRRPEFRDMHITGPPYVSARNVVHEGVTVRETTLRYIVCPMRQGRILIGPATIRIGGKEYRSDPQTLMVMAQRCFFMDGQQAGRSPYRFALHFEQPAEPGKGRRAWRRLNHIVLVPRSNAARMFHGLGSAIKVVCTIAGMFYLGGFLTLPVAAVAGNIAGWANCRVLYKIARVKPGFGYSETYPVVTEYLERGYLPGTELGVPVVKSHWIYMLGRALV